MKVIGLVGWSGSGKTTLLVKLLPELVGRGLKVSTAKHAHHNFDIDKPGKDSHQHRTAGATEVLVSSESRWALMHENRSTPELGLDEIVARMSPVDLLIVEGFKHHAHDKIEIHRGDGDQPLLASSDPHVVAVASDRPLADLDLPLLELDDVAAIARFIVAHCGLDQTPHGT